MGQMECQFIYRGVGASLFKTRVVGQKESQLIDIGVGERSVITRGGRWGNGSISSLTEGVGGGWRECQLIYKRDGWVKGSLSSFTERDGGAKGVSA